MALLVALGACASPTEQSGGLAPPTGGNLTVSVQGLPAGLPAPVTVSSAQGYQRALHGSETITGLPPGSYTITAGAVTADADQYGPAPETQAVTVPADGSTAVASVAYVLTTAKLQIVLLAVPAGASPSYTVSGPGGYLHQSQGPELLTGLAPGPYVVRAAPIVRDGDRFEARPDSQLIVLTIGAAPAVGSLTWALATGRLSIGVSGLPAGVASAIEVSGPGGYRHATTLPEMLAGLEPGAYTLTAGPVTAQGNGYAASPASIQVGVAASPTAAEATLAYGLATGALQVTVGGLPAGGAAAISVTGPGGYQSTFTGTATVTGLLPGIYTVLAAGTTVAGVPYAAVPPSQGVTVSAGLVPSGAAVAYAPAPGSLAVTVSGLPGGVNAAVTVTGPGGFSQAVTATQVLSGLVPGSYTIAAASVGSGGTTYAAAPASQGATVASGATATASVAYAPVPGALNVTVSGLPGGVNAAVTVTGPGGFSQAVTATQVLSGLAPGSYTIAAAGVASGGTTYTAAPGSQGATVASGATATASVAYTAAAPPPSLNLRVDGVYLTQATQRYDGSVPLVAGRDAYLRVFALANQANSAQPQVRVRLYSGGALLQTYTIPAPVAGVPLAADEGTLASSWNVLVPGSLVQPGLQVRADVDPAGTVAESDETDNQFPLSGAPATVDVRALPAFNVRFVPVLQQVNGAQGNVTAGNTESFLAELKSVLPVGPYSADVRAVYTTTAPALQSNDGNGAWGTILSEVLALRTADASTSYYYGVVHAGYSSGVAGLGYVGGSARTAIGWDYLPSGAHVMAHEVGHNMGRPHAPCGGASNPDPAYPYAGGQIGAWGFDVAGLTLKAPTLTDVMSYCQPDWISDYNWSLMVSYRASGPANAPAAAQAPGLLVWGRIGEQGVVLEPSFALEAAAPSLPAPGPYRLELLGAGGSVLRSVSFAADEAADLPAGAERHFAFVLPYDPALAGLRVRAGSQSAIRLSADSARSDPEPNLSRASASQVDLRWDASRYPMALVRDAATGQILSFARGGAARLWSRAGQFEVTFSDGVRSTARRVLTLR